MSWLKGKDKSTTAFLSKLAQGYAEQIDRNKQDSGRLTIVTTMILVFVEIMALHQQLLLKERSNNH